MIRSWRKIVPDISVEEFLRFEEDTTRVSERAKVLKHVQGGEDVDNHNNCEWLNYNIGEQG